MQNCAGLPEFSFEKMMRFSPVKDSREHCRKRPKKVLRWFSGLGRPKLQNTILDLLMLQERIETTDLVIPIVLTSVNPDQPMYQVCISFRPEPVFGVGKTT